MADMECRSAGVIKKRHPWLAITPKMFDPQPCIACDSYHSSCHQAAASAAKHLGVAFQSLNCGWNQCKVKEHLDHGGIWELNLIKSPAFLPSTCWALSTPNSIGMFSASKYCDGFCTNGIQRHGARTLPILPRKKHPQFIHSTLPFGRFQSMGVRPLHHPFLHRIFHSKTIPGWSRNHGVKRHLP